MSPKKLLAIQAGVPLVVLLIAYIYSIVLQLGPVSNSIQSAACIFTLFYPIFFVSKIKNKDALYFVVSILIQIVILVIFLFAKISSGIFSSNENCIFDPCGAEYFFVYPFIVAAIFLTSSSILFNKSSKN